MTCGRTPTRSSSVCRTARCHATVNGRPTRSSSLADGSPQEHRTDLGPVTPARPKLTTYLVLFRGINVGGKNKVPMAELKALLTELGYQDVRTYIQSGNAVVRSNETAETIARKIEGALPTRFKLDSELVRVLVLSREELETVIARRPKGFGDYPATYHSDAIFLMGVDTADAMPAFSPREGVDEVWPGESVVYSQRVSA